MVDGSGNEDYNREKSTERAAMDEKTLNNLTIAQLQDLLLSQQQELDVLHGHLEELREQLCETQAQLETRRLAAEEAGSIAQAALQLSGIFENAQQAADHYLENVESMHARQEADYLQRLAEAEQQAQDLLHSTQQQCAAMEQQARSKADYYWESLSQKIQQLYQQQPPELPVIEEAPLSSEEDACFGPDD